MNGIILINKPQQYTSFDVVAVLRKLLKIKKIGHTGTLDPMATGVLVLLIGNATRAADIIPNHNKSYKAEIKLGLFSDTGDIWGTVSENSYQKITEQQFKSAINKFKGNIMQVPPMFSAIKKDGVKLVDLARQGIEIERKARSVTIYDINICSFNEHSQSGIFNADCSKGTYIRTLCTDIGEVLGCGAVMSSLIRTSACGFNLEDCITLDEARELAEKGILKERLIPVDRCFADYPSLNISKNQGIRFNNGGFLNLDRLNKINDSDIYRIYSANKFLGLGKKDLDLKVLKVFKNFNEEK